MRIIVALLASVLWLKGNTHTHTAMSDGDSDPADVVKWYASHGYDFLVLSDHDKITKVDANEGMVLIDGEEVTDRLPKKPLHLIAIGIKEVVPPQHGETPVDVLQNNVNAIRKAGGIAAINHPNFGWAFGAEELKKIEGAALLEIASGHPYVNMQGPPSVESMWDEVLTSGKRIWGIGVDDSHHLKRPWDTDIAPPGKAWIVVRAEKRERDAILDAIQRGDFYASTGVELVDYVATAKSVEVKVKEKNGAHYRVQFIGKGGRVLQESVGATATYAVRGDEGYVRAKVVDSNGRCAWMQPMFIAQSSRD
ncbi:MAG TPA: CehA/McbA family metallohydrolase [Thermoanaerobaculia bacterium]